MPRAGPLWPFCRGRAGQLYSCSVIFGRTDPIQDRCGILWYGPQDLPDKFVRGVSTWNWEFQMFRQIFIFSVYTGEWGARRRESMFPKLQEKLRSDLRAVQQTYRDRCWILGWCFLVRIQSQQYPAIRSTEQKQKLGIPLKSRDPEISGIPIQQWMFSNNREIQQSIDIQQSLISLQIDITSKFHWITTSLVGSFLAQPFAEPSQVAMGMAGLQIAGCHRGR